MHMAMNDNNLMHDTIQSVIQTHQMKLQFIICVMEKKLLVKPNTDYNTFPQKIYHQRCLHALNTWQAPDKDSVSILIN